MVRVSKVRLVTAWNQHSAIILLIDIGQEDQGIGRSHINRFPR